MLQKQSQNCQILIDSKTENRCRLRKDQGLWKCNYFYQMDYSVFTITSLKSVLNPKKSQYRYILLLSVFMRIIIIIISIALLIHSPNL